MSLATWLQPARDWPAELVGAGFRGGDVGTHSSRTLMLKELADILACVPAAGSAADVGQAVLDDNCLGKATGATRRATLQRLRELYGLDPRIPLYRVLRRTWDADPPGRPLLAVLAALARDPLLRATAPAVLCLEPGAELVRNALLTTLRGASGDRFNAAILDKVARNAASSWAQAGHLEGRMRKLRRLVQPTPGSVALACWMGAAEGLGGESLLRSRWAQVLDTTGPALEPFVAKARQLGLLHARMGGGLVEIDTRPLTSGGVGA